MLPSLPLQHPIRGVHALPFQNLCLGYGLSLAYLSLFFSFFFLPLFLCVCAHMRVHARTHVSVCGSQCTCVGLHMHICMGGDEGQRKS